MYILQIEKSQPKLLIALNWMVKRLKRFATLSFCKQNWLHEIFTSCLPDILIQFKRGTAITSLKFISSLLTLLVCLLYNQQMVGSSFPLNCQYILIIFCYLPLFVNLKVFSGISFFDQIWSFNSLNNMEILQTKSLFPTTHVSAIESYPK